MKNLTRRSFMTLGGVAAASTAAVAVTGCTSSGDSSGSGSQDATASSSSSDAWDESDQVELDVPEESAPSTTDYEVDILVVGCGVAGLQAAYTAKAAGKDVLVVDKGYPGYSGLSPFAVNRNYFDEDFGDDVDKTCTLAMQANEYTANLNWMRVWCERSKEYYERITEWGATEQYDHANATEYWVDGYFDGSPGHDDKRGYFRSVSDVERHKVPAQVLSDNDIEVLDHTMVFDVVESDGRVAGAVAYHVPSGTNITIKAKAVILCTGSGCVKPLGYPVGGSSYDGLYIGYQHGLPVAGMEYEDYHLAYAGKPGLVLTTAGWAYCENLAPGGPGAQADTSDDDLWGSAYQQKLVYTNVTEGLADPDPSKQRENTGKAASDDPDDPRQGNFTSAETSWGAPGAAPAMSLHMVSGIFNGFDDVDCATALPGLYCAGDGTYASMIGGSDYDGISGLTTSSCGVQGMVAAENACDYADGVELVDLDSSTVDALFEELTAPLSMEQGYDPNWANNQLLNIMANPTTLYLKSEASLNAALTQLEYLRDTVVPMLKAKNSHEVRLCREFTQKVLACEIKLRCGLERKESRGMHYRTDYPYRDDSYLGTFAVTKNGDSMDIEFIEEPDDWKGDTSMDYVDRYPMYHFPGEEEALGVTFPVEESSW